MGVFFADQFFKANVAAAEASAARMLKMPAIMAPMPNESYMASALIRPSMIFQASSPTDMGYTARNKK